MSPEVWAEELNFYNIVQEDLVPSKDENPMRPKSPPWKMALWDFLEEPASKWARTFSSISLGILLVATAFFVLESMHEYDTPHWRKVFNMYELVSIVFFTAEFLLRLLATAQPKRFMMSLLNLVDLGAILPFYVTAVLPRGESGGLAVLRVVRLTKVFRVLRIGKYSKGLQLLIQVPRPPCPLHSGYLHLIRKQHARAAPRMHALNPGWPEYWRAVITPLPHILTNLSRSSFRMLSGWVTHHGLYQTLVGSVGELSVMALFLFIGVLLFGSFVYMTDSANSTIDCGVENPTAEILEQ